MRTLRFSELAFIAIALFVGGPAFAAGTPLESFLDGLKTLRASFVQVVVDSGGRVAERSRGLLVVQRPGKFRWETSPQTGQGQEQLLVADGKNVWFYDRELKQVTVKPADAALSATPAMLLSSTGDLREKFVVTSAPPRDGLQWVLVEPKSAEADFRQALLGFAKNGLGRMIVEDKLGQTATVTFENVARNGEVQPEEMKFVPPAGVDVIGKPAE